MPHSDEHRRTPRVATHLWVTIAGLDREPQFRRGNISATGVYLELERAVDSAGSIQSLTIEPPDRSMSVEVIARIIRSVTFDDIEQQSARVGVAFDFMPESTGKVEALRSLTSRIAKNQSEELIIGQRLGADVVASGAGPREATVFQLSVQRMELETSWPVQHGEVVQVVFRSPGRQNRIAFEGEVATVQSMPGEPARYSVSVAVERMGDRATPTPGADQSGPDAISESVDLIFSDLLETKPSRANRREHLVGVLSRIHITSLLSLLEMEESTGELSVSRGGQKARLYFRGGRLIDAELSPGETSPAPRAVVAELFGWKDGTFDFAAVEVAREDRLNMPLTTLMLEVTRERDERGVE